MKKLLCGCVAAALMAAAGSVAAMDNFVAAKKELPKITRALDKPATVYCAVPITFNERGRWQVDPLAAGYRVRKNAKRAVRIEAEHVMPAWDFGHQLQCWAAKNGRKNCEKTSPEFNRMEGDLHNLFPALGEVNGDRNNFRFSDWNGTPTQYGSCQMVIDFAGKRAQPPQAARGLIARAYLYMSQQYGIRLADQQRKLYEAWNRQYAPSANECRRNQLIKKVQGNDNPFITARCSN